MTTAQHGEKQPSEEKAAVFMRTSTLDRIAVLFWEDGSITDLSGCYPPGTGRVRGEALKLHGGVCALVAQVCPEYLYQRLPEMIRAARSMMARPPAGLPAGHPRRAGGKARPDDAPEAASEGAALHRVLVYGGGLAAVRAPLDADSATVDDNSTR